MKAPFPASAPHAAAAAAATAARSRPPAPRNRPPPGASRLPPGIALRPEPPFPHPAAPLSASQRSSTEPPGLLPPARPSARAPVRLSGAEQPTAAAPMARAPGPKVILFLPLLAVPLACVCAAPGASGRGDSHSLHYDFNISSDKQPWCMVQGKMDEEKYLLYDCGSNKVISRNLPREEGKAIHSCEGELGTLSNMGNELKPLLADIKREKYADGAPVTLQVRMTCHGSTRGSLEFSLGGQRLLTFHSETEEYKADDSEGERLKKKWEKYEDLSKDFKMTLKGDCKELYKCWVHRKTELETTAAPTTVPAPATTTPTKASATTTKTTDGLETWAIIPIVLLIFIMTIICIIYYIYRKRWQRCCSKAPGSPEQLGRERQWPDQEQLVVIRTRATEARPCAARPETARSSPAPAPRLPLRHGWKLLRELEGLLNQVMKA